MNDNKNYLNSDVQPSRDLRLDGEDYSDINKEIIQAFEEKKDSINEENK